MNIKLNYLYRDASNYKNYGSVVFSNSNHVSLRSIESAIRQNLIDSEYFVAEIWQLPSLFFSEQNKDDHIWHEYESVEFTYDNVNFIPIEDFLMRLMVKLN
ncbi:hypothetical protein OGH69_16820 [Flavobacterium sp. MFBS3-15]|uniref:hypothetical protein n=1 Tax=Flavobacterium sp. MFBS3-15 TaxID=2989816 RepID=UPI00223685A1|nr:hypothetical protein [Flavobacterium sp. MFBS3-15]MCW4470637.1 hypothetical protein [Flavobacterium sp. MFBS3-15]